MRHQDATYLLWFVAAAAAVAVAGVVGVAFLVSNYLVACEVLVAV